MKKAYKFLTKHLLYIMLCALGTTLVGSLAMHLGYNKTTSWMKINGACTILFVIAILFTIGYAAFISFKVPECKITRIKKKFAFMKAMAILAFVLLFFMFIRETWTLILASYQGALPSYFTIWRILKYAFSFPASIYFLLVALPSKTRRRKRIKIPKAIQYVTSVSVILWCIFGLLAAYFYSQMSIKNILKIWQLLIYLVFIVFLLFEAKFEHLNDGKKTHRGYIFTALLAFIASMAFSLTTTISMIFRIVPTETGISFSAVEIFTSFVIGMYALSRVFAYNNTIRAVVYDGEDATVSHKFRSHRHHHSNESAASDNADTVVINEISESVDTENE